jgi:transposase InsO family protein
VYAAVEAIVASTGWPSTAICGALDACRSAYYAWRTAPPAAREQRDTELTATIQAVFWKHRRRYGARRIASELADLGQQCSPRRVAKLMKNQVLRAIQPKSFVPKTTDSNHRLGYSPNLLLESPEPDGIHQLLVGDITYIPLRGGKFCYLAMLMDRFSRLIVGWQLGQTMTDELTLGALLMAIRERQPPAGAIHHTDRGGQYASVKYRNVLHRAGFRQSMSRADNCYDNAFMESCFGRIKTELEMVDYDHHLTARREIAEHIAYYNNQRKHSSLGNLTPRQFEAALARRN